MTNLLMKVISACSCNGQTVYDNVMATHVGECRTMEAGQPWCYVKPYYSGCFDEMNSIRTPFRRSFQACRMKLMGATGKN